MSKVRIYGDTSGYVDIAVPAVAGTRTLNLDKVPQTATNGNTGIGTDNPSQNLHVSSTDHTRVLITGGTDKYAELQFENDAQKFAMGVQNDDKFFLYNSTGTSQVLTIDTSNNVGIGTQTPEYPLQVSGTNVSSGGGLATLGIYDTGTAYNGTNPGGGITFRGKYNNSGSMTNFATVQGVKENTTDGNYATALRFTTRENGGNLTEKMRIASNGNVGIGNSPESAVKLEINAGSDGAVAISGRSDGGNGNNRRFNLIPFADGGGANYGGGLKIQTRDSVNVFHDRITVKSDGKVGIGTTGPTEILEVKTSSSPTIEFNQADTYRGAVRLAGNDLELRNSSGVIDFFVGTDNDHDSNSTKAITIANDANTTFNGDIIANKHLRLYTTDDQASQWYVYNHTDDTLRFNYNGSGNDEAIFYTNGNIDFAGNSTTSVRINSNARSSTGLNVGGASTTATGIYVDNSDGGATLDIAMLGSGYGAHGASAGEVWFYSPDNINIGGATGSSNTINFLGGGRKNIQFYNEGVVFYPEVGNRGDLTFPICSISNAGAGGQYLHAQFQAGGGDMLHIHFRGYEYIGSSMREGSGGGYIYNTGGQNAIYAEAKSGHCVSVYQTTTNRVELVIDTGHSATSNRWGSYVFFGGTDTITGNSPLSLVQYGFNSSTGRLYSS